MTVINVTLPFGLIKKVDDYSKVINVILEQHISVNILKFSTGRSGINLLLDIPEDKITTETFFIKSKSCNKKEYKIIINL